MSGERFNLTGFIHSHHLGEGFVDTATKWFIPLAESMSTHQKSAKPLVVGINGCQGSGKSTLSAFLKEYIEQTCQLTVAVLSLDDFYFSHERRTELAKSIHPLLQTRGVPGTHDIPLACEVMSCLKLGQSCHLPRFDKSTDDPFPKEQWPKVNQPIDIVLLEGWCLGALAQSSQSLQDPVNELEAVHDANGQWRHYVNEQLTSEYPDLHWFVDYWIMLQAPSFDVVSSWRTEQEQKLKVALDDENAGMNTQQLRTFIQHYQRITEHTLDTLASRVDEVFLLNEQREIVSHQIKRDN